MANYGSKDHKDARHAAAASDKNLAGAGQKPGLEVWRVENVRTKSDTPDFGVKRWDKTMYGQFYSGDSYLCLNTFKCKDENGKETEKLGWDVHFWLGKDSSQDEIGVAAYKAVELDDLLSDGPVQHREVQGEESPLFLSYFGAVQYLEGGIASGFRQVKPEEYKPRLFQVRQSGKNLRSGEVPVNVTSMNAGDTFILDAGLKVYIYIGPESNAFEKSKGGALAHNIVSGRMGKSKLIPEPDDEMWKILSAKGPKDVPAAIAEGEKAVKTDKDLQLKSENCKLFRLSDSTGKIEFTKVMDKGSKINASMLDTNDVFVLDADIQLFVWVGKKSSKEEKSQAMKVATEYLKKENRPLTMPVTRVLEGQVNHVFGALVKW